MTSSVKTIIAAAILASLSACVVVATPELDTTAIADVPDAEARQACVRDVREATGNADVTATESYFSQAGTQVTLSVGPTGTWQCTAYSDGTTGGIMSTTDEGSL